MIHNNLFPNNITMPKYKPLPKLSPKLPWTALFNDVILRELVPANSEGQTKWRARRSDFCYWILRHNSTSSIRNQKLDRESHEEASQKLASFSGWQVLSPYSRWFNRWWLSSYGHTRSLSLSLWNHLYFVFRCY